MQQPNLGPNRLTLQPLSNGRSAANPKRRQEFKQHATANKTTQTSYKAAENFQQNTNINVDSALHRRTSKDEDTQEKQKTSTQECENQER